MSLLITLVLFVGFVSRHGLRQYRSGWADGPAYITQCPIRSKQSYTYRFKVEDQRGTLLWHAHHSWQRASVYGAFIIYPRQPYPFSGSHIQSEIPIILGTIYNYLFVFLSLKSIILSKFETKKDQTAYVNRRNRVFGHVLIFVT